MHYYSTERHSGPVDFKEATVTGQAPDGGLFYPEFIPALSSWLKGKLSDCPKDELAFRVMRPYVGATIPDEDLYNIAAETVNFPFPLVPVASDIYSLELFHGPTLAFKDVGARFMSRCLGYFNQGNPQKLTVLVATSGDTGGAVANGFENVEGVEVIILYPSGKVSPVQELQLTTCAANIYALEIKGSFDDCQAMVKKAFADDDLKLSYQLTSANSINVARWLPQQLYYFFALQQWPHEAAPVMSVPSGNFGNICAGMVAQRSGLPIAHFIAACNANDVVPQYLEKGILYEKKAVATISNAMDVALPSNFVRIMEMYDQDLAWLKTMLSGCSVNDDLTRRTIDEVYRQHHYTLDPHGAVGYYALRQYLDRHPGAKGIFLETAHPVKFPEVVKAVTGQTIAVPGHVQALFQKQKRSTLLDASYEILKDWLLAR